MDERSGDVMDELYPIKGQFEIALFFEILLKIFFLEFFLNFFLNLPCDGIRLIRSLVM